MRHFSIPAVTTILLLVGSTTRTVIAAASTTSFDTAKVPNGESVFVNDQYWPAVFNSTWRGGSDSLNPFGVAFQSASFSWTSTLCNLDSDGDGFTNGEELGDPNCLWAVGANISEISGGRSTKISHPGFWSSVPVDAFSGRTQTAASSCTRDTAPALTASAELDIVRSRSGVNLQIPSGLVGVTQSAQYVKEFKPAADADVDWGTNYACPHQQSGLEDWHNPATWSSGSVPTAGTDVTLPNNKKILISSCSIPHEGFKKIVVPSSSQLIFNDAVIHLRVKDIEVYGQLWMGSAHCPINSPITLTFIATKAEKASYTNGLIAQNQGKLELHGAHREWTWTRLRATAVRGSTVLVLQDPVDWSPGEDIVITTSILKDLEQNQNEERRILKIDPANRTLVLLDKPLKFDHYGGVEYQSEVGVLSRSILVRGDTSGHGDFYGGHIMASAQTTTLKVSGVRADRMGQRNEIGRYPFHIHLVGELGNNSYIQQVACSNCYFRCAVVHGANHSLVRKSVAFNTSGHTFYLEDGAEMFNRVEYNLAAYVVPIGRPAVGVSQGGEDFLADSETVQPADHTAAGFYVPNPHNYVIGNAASGGWSGFSYPIFYSTIETSQHITFDPSTFPVLKFEGNTAHSSGYFWADAGCIYFGGHLWKEGNTLKYSNGRYTHKTATNPETGKQQWNNVTHTRAWLCEKGFSSWGVYVDIDHFEAADVERSALLFGTSSLSNALVTGTSKNDPLDQQTAHNGRQGFQFYATNVKTILFNIEFRNYWTKKNWRMGSRDAIFSDLTHSDKWRPVALSTTKQIRTNQGVDRGILINRWVRETSAYRMWSLVDWDGSVTNSADCSAWIIGSGIDWWNAGDGSCYQHDQWVGSSWVCRRVPGREAVAIDMDLPGIIGDPIEIQRNDEPGGFITAEEKSLTEFGWMTQFGSEGQKRKLRLTRNHHMATGLSGIGWYMWTWQGMPEKITIDPLNFPRGTSILLAIGYPQGTNFSGGRIYGETNSEKDRVYWTEVSSRDLVAQGNGTQYHFDGANLYLKVADLWSQAPLYYSRHGVNVYAKQNAGYLFVHADCSHNLTAPDSKGYRFCHPVTFQAPPELSTNAAGLKNLTCDSQELLDYPTPMEGACSAKTDIPPSGYARCDDYHSKSSCASKNDDCAASCGECRRLVPYPSNCSWTPECDAQGKPPVIQDFCTKQMNEFPLSEVCRIARCDPQTGVMEHLTLPEGTPCEISSKAGGGGFGLCDRDSECDAAYGPSHPSVPTAETLAATDVSILNGRGVDDTSGQVDLQISDSLANVTGVSVTCQVLGAAATTTTTFSLTQVADQASGGWYSGSPTSNQHCIRDMEVSVTTTSPATSTTTVKKLLIKDWRKNINTVPQVVVLGVENDNVATIRIDPADHIHNAVITFQDGTGVESGTWVHVGGSSTYNQWTFTIPQGQTFSGHSNAQIEFTFLHSNLTMNRTLPCLKPGGAFNSACTTDTTNLHLAAQPTCLTTAARISASSGVHLVKVLNIPSNLQVKNVVFKGYNMDLSGSDGVLAWDSAKEYYKGETKKLVAGTQVIVEISFNDTSKGSDFFTIELNDPVKLWSLRCLNGSKVIKPFVPFVGTSGVCTADFQCVPGQPPPTPAPPTPAQTPVSPPTPAPAPSSTLEATSLAASPTVAGSSSGSTAALTSLPGVTPTAALTVGATTLPAATTAATSAAATTAIVGTTAVATTAATSTTAAAGSISSSSGSFGNGASSVTAAALGLMTMVLAMF